MADIYPITAEHPCQYEEWSDGMVDYLRCVLEAGHDEEHVVAGPQPV